MTKKTVLITGGARRIGKLLCLGLNGYEFVIHYHQSEKEACSLKEELSKKGARVEIFKADLRKDQEIEALFNFIQTKVKKLDVLINNAASYDKTDFTQPFDFDKTFHINVKAPLLLAQKAAAIMPKGSCIINVCDRSALDPFEGYLLHSVSKAALLFSTQALAQELAPNIRVNALLLGAILPEEHKNPETFDRLIKKHVLVQRAPLAQELVQTVNMILENGYLNAATIHLDGGWKL